MLIYIKNAKITKFLLTVSRTQFPMRVCCTWVHHDDVLKWKTVYNIRKVDFDAALLHTEKLYFQSLSKVLKLALIVNLLEKYGILGMITSRIMGKDIV